MGSYSYRRSSVRAYTPPDIVTGRLTETPTPEDPTIPHPGDQKPPETKGEINWNIIILVGIFLVFIFFSGRR